MARLVEAYECDPVRARHVLEWEHLPGRSYQSNTVIPEVEKQIAKAEDDALRHLRLTALHQGNDASLEYDGLLNDWYGICGTAREYDFDFFNFISDKYGPNEHISNIFLTASEREKQCGWTIEEIDRLRQGDSTAVVCYRKELEGLAEAKRLRGDEARAWIENELIDLSNAADRKLLQLRHYAIHDRLSKWEVIERTRAWAESFGLQQLWKSTLESNPGIDIPPPPPLTLPSQATLHFLPKDIEDTYQRLKELEGKLWISRDPKMLSDSESLMDRLIRMSMKIEDSAGIKAYMEMKEKERQEQGRTALPTSFGWYGYYGAMLDAEENEKSEDTRLGRSEGKLYIQWAKELIGLLPSIVNRCSRLKFHPFAAIGEQIPIAHRTLFEQAHMLYIFDFDIPCTLTCGTLIEELVEKEFPEFITKWSEEKTVWELKVNDIVLRYPQYLEAKPFLENIMDNRNVAAHDPSAYLRNGNMRSESILRMTRKVLEIFFEVANSQSEEN